MPSKQKKEKNQPKPIEEVVEEKEIIEESKPKESTQLSKSEAKNYLARSLSALLAVASIGFACYAIFLLIKDGISSSDSISTYITLNGKSASESKAVFDTYKTDNQKGIKDYGLIGNKLYISKSKITPDLINGKTGSNAYGEGYVDIALWNLTNNLSFTSGLTSDSKNGHFYIDLANCSVGDYLVYPYTQESTTHQASNTAPFSLSEKESVSQTFYTKIENGKRRKIVFKNNEASPYTLITVSETGTLLPDNTYDAVVFYQQYDVDNNQAYTYTNDEINALKQAVSNINQAGNYNLVFANDLKEANSYNATYSICISNNLTEVYNSLFINRDGYTVETLLDNSSLNDYDKYPEIRELTGYLDKAGEAYQDVAYNDVLSGVVSRYGKESYIIPKGDNVETSITSFLQSC